MKTLKIGSENYILEYGFEAAMESDVVQMEFDILTGASMAKEAETFDGKEINAMLTATSKIVGSIPTFVSKAFYAGIKLHHEDLDKADSDRLLKTYMKQEKISFMKMNTVIQECMQDDGFFEISGLMETIEDLTTAVEDQVKEIENEMTAPKTQTKPKARVSGSK